LKDGFEPTDENVSTDLTARYSINRAICSYKITLVKIEVYFVRRKLGLSEIWTKQAVDNFLQGCIQTKDKVCNKLDYQTNSRDIYLFHLLMFQTVCFLPPAKEMQKFNIFTFS
jgi:hypothetical protein